MRLELIPTIAGLLVILLAAAIIADAWGDPDTGVMRDRRRRIRASIDRTGERMVGIGTLFLGAALVGQDRWRFSTLNVLIGAILLVWGGVRNRRYMKEMLLFRGAARRGLSDSEKPSKLRIR